MDFDLPELPRALPGALLGQDVGYKLDIRMPAPHAQGAQEWAGHGRVGRIWQGEERERER